MIYTPFTNHISLPFNLNPNGLQVLFTTTKTTLVSYIPPSIPTVFNYRIGCDSVVGSEDVDIFEQEAISGKILIYKSILVRSGIDIYIDAAQIIEGTLHIIELD